MVHLSCVLYVAIHTSATGSHKATTNLATHYSEGHDVKKCYRCLSQYSSSKHGACVSCYPRDQCFNQKCTELAYCDKDLGSFNYCSRECRDKCELKRANEELRRALKEFEVVPGLEASNKAPKGRSRDEKIHGHGVESTFFVSGITMTITGTHQSSFYTSSRSNPSTPYTTSSTWSNPSTPYTTSSNWSNPSTPYTTSSIWSNPSTSHTTSSTWSSTSTPHTTSSIWRNHSSPHMTSNMSAGSASQPITSTKTIMSQSDTKNTIPANPPAVTSHRQSTPTVTSQPQSLSQSKIKNFLTVYR